MLISFHDIIILFKINYEANELTKKIRTSNLKASLRLEQEAYLQDNALLALSVCSSPTTSWFSACDNKHTSQSIKIYITWNQKEPKTPRDKNGMWNLLIAILKMLCATFSKTFFTSPGVASQRRSPPTTADSWKMSPNNPWVHGSKGLDGKVCCRPNTIQGLRGLFCLRFYWVFFQVMTFVGKKRGRFLHTTSNLFSHLLPLKLLKSSQQSTFSGLISIFCISEVTNCFTKPQDIQVKVQPKHVDYISQCHSMCQMSNTSKLPCAVDPSEGPDTTLQK